MELNTYLTFNGNCRAAFEHYQKVLGGTIEFMMTHEGTPAEAHVPPEWKDKIMHARLRVGNSLLMGSDTPPNRPAKPGGFSVNIGIKDLDQAKKVFHELAENGTIHMPFEKTFWARGFGMAVDQFGIPWMINCE